MGAAMSDPASPSTIGFLGRIPAPLGGAGLELQMARTAAALEELGHRVVQVEAAGSDEGFDVLHAFGSEPAVWHQLRHWTRNPAPLVVTSVIVVSPGREERALRLSARVPRLKTSGRMRAEVLRRADAVVAGSEYERDLVTGLGVDAAKVSVIGNGADPGPDENTPPDGTPDGDFVLLVGAVSPRKGQAELLRALGGAVPAVVAGEYAGAPGERGAWERTVAEAGAVWLGPVESPSRLGALQRRAAAFVHLSSAEVQSLAVLEALARGTPAVLSDIPSHRELERAHPGLVQVVGGPDEVLNAVEELRGARRGEASAVPGWGDVAGKLAEVYRAVYR
jgi:glycosyltransferase involved in cell wall biosynthesis